MKKILCYFLLLVFPTSIFSQDKSLLAENFSLIKYSRNNNFNFSIPTTALSVNNLFQLKEKYHSNHYKIFQIPRFQQSSERPFLIEAYVFKNKKQKWGYAYSAKYGQGQNIGSEEKAESLAEAYLKRLAERKKKSRKTGGAIGLIGGGLCLGLGVFAWSSAESRGAWGGIMEALAAAMLITAGAPGVVSGVLSLAIPCGAEREYKDVRRISDPAQRERACHEALSMLASRGKKRRIITVGILIAGLSAYILSSKKTESSLLVVTFGAYAVNKLTRRTAAERAYQNYLKESKLQRRIKKLIGIKQQK